MGNINSLIELNDPPESVQATIINTVDEVFAGLIKFSYFSFYIVIFLGSSVVQTPNTNDPMEPQRREDPSPEVQTSDNINTVEVSESGLINFSYSFVTRL